MSKLAIINYSMGNLTSITNALEYLEIEYEIVNYNDLKFSQNFDGYILPGVGSFEKAMSIINKYKLDMYLYNEIKNEKKPILGICLGMQLLFESSTEGGLCEGLKFIDGKVTNFDSVEYKIPHVGWNEVEHNDNILFNNIKSDTDFYFDHSYFVKTDDKYTISTTNYIINFTSAINKDNIYGVQFHPEKSQIIGLEVFKNFAQICGVDNA